MLILSSVKHPKFYIRFNTENYRDFEVNFEGHDTSIHKKRKELLESVYKTYQLVLFKNGKKT